MRAWVAVLAAFVIALPAHAQKMISFPTEDSGVIFADLYGHGDNSVVLAMEARFNKESWAPQARTWLPQISCAGPRFPRLWQLTWPGRSRPARCALHLDVLAAVHYLRQHGAKTVSAVGASMGGGAAGDASITTPPGTSIASSFSAQHPISLLIGSNRPAFSSSPAMTPAGTELRLPWIRAQYEKAPSRRN